MWRCGNRLDYGVKYCRDAATLDEESLHDAIAEAIIATRKSRHEMIPYFMSHVERTLREEKSGFLDVAEMESRIEELKTATMELVAEMTHTLEAEPEEVIEYNDSLVRQLIDTIKVIGTDRLLVIFKNGLEYEESIQPKVKKINWVA